jgi:hypothetical protein
MNFHEKESHYEISSFFREKKLEKSQVPPKKSHEFQKFPRNFLTTFPSTSNVLNLLLVFSNYSSRVGPFSGAISDST